MGWMKVNKVRVELKRRLGELTLAEEISLNLKVKVGE